ncbi:MAG: hypothetical protein ICV51_09305 [Flavisolibacter sp.]|nr:hypothetical protein [Flavisolibacter sp.]MBD0375811.1 hypothetical protein [Flavisolibacter sp.]
MKGVIALEGGLAGALALTLLHEVFRKIDPKAPRMDLLGMNAISKTLRKAGISPPPRTKLFYITMAGDIISNALYYSMAIRGRKKMDIVRGLLLGSGAGLGALLLPKPLQLNKAYTNRTTKTKVLTIALYIIGGVVAASVASYLEKGKAL